MRRAGRQMIAPMRQQMKSRAEPGMLSVGYLAPKRRYASTDPQAAEQSNRRIA